MYRRLPRIESAPKMGVVIPLQDILASVVQIPIAQQKPQPAVVQIILVVALDGVRNKGHAYLSLGLFQSMSVVVAAEQNGLPDLGIGEGLVLVFIPAEAREEP